MVKDFEEPVYKYQIVADRTIKAEFKANYMMLPLIMMFRPDSL